MKNGKAHFLFSILFTLGFAIQALLSQSSQVPYGARPAGMGDAFVALENDANTLFWNPAGMSWLEHHELITMYGNPLGVPGYSNRMLGYVFPVSSRLALGASGFFDGVQDLDDNSLGLDFGWTMLQLSSSYKFTDKLSFGLTGKFVQMSASEDLQQQGSPVGFGADLGAFYKTNKWRFGAMWQDAGGMRIRHAAGSAGDATTPDSLRSSWETVRDQLFRLGAAWSPRSPLTFSAMITPGDRIHFGAEYWMLNDLVAVRAGLQHDVYDTPSPETIYAAGFSLKKSIVRIDYAYVMPPVLPNSSRLSLSLAVSFRRAKVKLSDERFDRLFPSRYGDYQALSLGHVTLANEEKTEILASVEFFIPALMEKAETVISNKTMAPGETSTIHFSPKSLLRKKALAVDNPRGANAEVRVLYDQGADANFNKKHKRRYRVQLLKAGAVSWKNGPGAAASFISRDAPIVQQFARDVLDPFADDLSKVEGSDNLHKAAILFDALGRLDIRYFPDQEKPFVSMVADTSGDAFDVIHYPSETLTRYGRGDCDDLTVLYASLLESVDVPTALAFSPGHIFLLVDSGQKPYAAEELFDDPSVYHVRDDRLWLPVEVTMIGQNFHQAVINSRIKDLQQMVTVEKAWTQFRPGYPAQENRSLPAPQRSSIETLYHADLKWLQTRGLSAERENLEKTLATQPDHLTTLKKLALLERLENNRQRAKELYLRLTELETDVPEHLFELGRLHSADGEFDAAERQAQALQTRFPQQPYALVLRAIAFYEAGNDQEALQVYSQAKQLDPEAAVVKEYKVDVWINSRNEQGN